MNNNNENKFSDVVRESLEGIRGMMDANTVVGEPIASPNGTLIVPVSKMFVGYASGGIDYLGKRAKEKLPSNFGTGGGCGVTLTPVAFLVIAPDGHVELLNLSTPTDTVSQVVSFIENSPELIERFKKIFASKKSEDGEKKDEGENA